MWYYMRNGLRIGPVDDATISNLIGNGTIVRQTSVWREGMAGWQEASGTELGAKFTGIPPAPPSGSTLATYAEASASYTPESFRKLWLWFAWLMGAGLPLCLICIGLIPLIAGVVIGYILLYRYWMVIQDGNARTSPGKAVGFCFIPFFNFYWLYVAYVGLAKDMNTYCEERHIAVPRVNEGLALTFFILGFCTWVPYIGFLFSIAYTVILIIVMKQFTDVAVKILELKKPVV